MEKDGSINNRVLIARENREYSSGMRETARIKAPTLSILDRMMKTNNIQMDIKESSTTMIMSNWIINFYEARSRSREFSQKTINLFLDSNGS